MARSRRTKIPAEEKTRLVLAVLSGQDEATMQRQKYLWNFLIDHWFRMEFDRWDNLPEPPVLLVGIHSGAPFVWDA